MIWVGLILFLATWLLIEISLHGLFRYLNKRFQWLILAKDKYPIFSTALLKKYFNDGFDAELGWSRKPNTEKNEQGKAGITTYHIDANGARKNPDHDSLPVYIASFGDSFTFGRQVNDNQTFQWYLSQLTGSNVLNYGVGNYGFDQALLRLKRDYQPQQKIVIIGVVPSTITRILSVWKHYNEFGNILAFKPRFTLQNGQLTLIPNIINSLDKFKHYQQYLPEINALDIFYQAKFLPEMLHFPYLYSLAKNPQRHISLLGALLRDRLIGADYEHGLANIMQRNLLLRKNLFQNPSAVQLLHQLIDAFVAFAKEKHFTPIVLWMPQKDDVIDIVQHGNYYADFLNKARRQCEIIDVTSALSQTAKLDEYYSDDSVYGGHFSPAGNQLVAQLIYQQLAVNQQFKKHHQEVSNEASIHE